MFPENLPLPRCRILCFGNALHGDDGFGPAVYAALPGALSEMAAVTWYCPGTRGLDVLHWFEADAPLLLVDMLQTKTTPPGQLAWVAAADLLPESRISTSALLHGAGLGDLLQLARSLYGKLPPLAILLASSPGVTPFSMRLSPALAAAVPRACTAIREHLWLQSGDMPSMSQSFQREDAAHV